MNEAFIQYLWKNRLINHNCFVFPDGQQFELLDPGEQNTNAGPDFFNTKIRINRTTWAGNTEIHINSSDWFKHGHHKDKAYDNVILHVVLNNDSEVKRANGEIIPAVEIQFKPMLYENYTSLIKKKLWIPCQDKLKNVDPAVIRLWLHSLLIERLERKTNEILDSCHQNKNNWEETFYHFLAQSFGFNVNSAPFRLLAKSLPLKYIAKHKNNLMQLEAMLFGQAGMLDKNCTDKYYETLRAEYKFLKNKFNLKPIDQSLWKLLRLRPYNFPTIRISQFAVLMHDTSHFFSQVLEAKDITALEKMFNVKATAYWDNHYNFGKTTPGANEKKLGKNAFQTIVINTIVPFLFIYGKVRDNHECQDRAISLLEKLPAEKNSIIKKWAEIGIAANNAYVSQALLQLKNEYCKTKNCLQCQVGNKIIIEKP